MASKANHPHLSGKSGDGGPTQKEITNIILTIIDDHSKTVEDILARLQLQLVQQVVDLAGSCNCSV